MNTSRVFCCLVIAAMLLGAPGNVELRGMGAGEPPRAEPATSRLAQIYGNLPVGFELNRGQTDPAVRFLARGQGYGVYLTPTEMVLSLSGTETALRLGFAGANHAPGMRGVDELPGKANYLRGSDPSRWHTAVPRYRQVRYEAVYPGIDVVVYGSHGRVEYDLLVAPGTDPGIIALEIKGAESLRLDDRGNLILQIPGGHVVHEAPILYQDVDGVRRPISGSYVLLGKNRVGFRVGPYDRGHALVIDPVLTYSTYLGGTAADFVTIAVDADGNAYVTGATGSLDFPTVNALQPVNAGTDPALPQFTGNEVFIAKFDPTGSILLYSTYLGGSSVDLGAHIAVDAMGQAYVTGFTFSADFPTTVNAFQPTFAGGSASFFVRDAFVAKLDPTGSTLIYSTFLGGATGDDTGSAIATDAAGNAYVTGRTSSADFPIVNALQPAFGGPDQYIRGDAFVTKLDALGAPVYSTYLGGSADDAAFDIASDGAGNAYVTGGTLSTDFPTFNALQPMFAGGPGGANQMTRGDVFIAKLNPSGSAFEYATYLGGSGGEDAFSIAVDVQGNAYVAGVTTSADLPTVSPLQAAPGGGDDVFIAKLNPSGSGLLYSTYLGGSGNDAANGLAVDLAGNAHLIGNTTSPDFPVVDAIQTTLAGIFDAFVTKINPSGSSLVYSTYLGGSGIDFGRGIAIDDTGLAWVAGATSSLNFPIVNALQPAKAGGQEGFVAIIVDGDGIVGAAGGTVVDTAGTGATFSVAAGVLTQDIRVAIDVILDPGVSPPAGFVGPATTFVSFKLVPNPSPLPPPGATIQLPLAFSLPAGTPLPLFKFDPATGTLVATGVVGTVDAGSVTATFSGVIQFSVFVALRPIEPDPAGAMLGAGYVDASGRRHFFEFLVYERGDGTEGGQFGYWVRTQRAVHGRYLDSFFSSAITAVRFSYDPTIPPSVATVRFSGTGRWNGTPGFLFEVSAIDRHAPGRGRDEVSITVTDPSGSIVATVNGALGGGGIQSRRP